MVIKWCEREHEGTDNQDLNDPDIVNVLRQCGLLKYLKIPSMRSKTPLLQLLIRYWDPDKSQFIIDDEPISFEVEDIYFLTGLSHRGWELNLCGGGRGDASLTIQEYIDTYYKDGTQKVASQIPIARITTLALHSIVFCLVNMLSTTAQHVISHPLVYYALECTWPTIFDWCIGLLVFVRAQLMKWNMGQHRNFGYGILICSFFFKRVLALSPWVSLPPLRETDSDEKVDCVMV